MLRGRQLGGFKFLRQHPIDRYFADFACTSARLIVEIDGNQHGANLEYDLLRTRHLEQCGWQVIVSRITM